MQPRRIFPVISRESVKRICDPSDPICPFSDYVGNRKAVDLAITIAKLSFSSYMKLGNTYICDRKNPVRILLTGPGSVGKTTFAKKFYDLIGRDYGRTNKVIFPWVEVDGTNPKAKLSSILHSIEQELSRMDCTVFYEQISGKQYAKLPPLILFIDEVHGLKYSIRENLLKMCEANDGRLEVDDKIVDAKDITILAATTKPGELDSTLLSRFPLRIDLQSHTKEEVAQIICNNYKGFPFDQAVRLAKMKPLPRESLAIAKLVVGLVNVDGISVKEAVSKIQVQLNLDEDGLSQKAIKVLVALSETPLSKKNLCSIVGVGVSEFENIIMPQLLKDSLIVVGTRHHITETGRQFLIRKI